MIDINLLNSNLYRLMILNPQILEQQYHHYPYIDCFRFHLYHLIAYRNLEIEPKLIHT